MPNAGRESRKNSNIWSVDAEAKALAYPSGSLVAIPYDDNPCAVLAELILNRNAATLPDLSHCLVLLPDLGFAPALRLHLAEQAKQRGTEALLGPTVLTLRQWAARQASPLPVPTPHVQELMLVDSLNFHRRLFGDSDPWLLARDLLELFAELTLQRVQVPVDLDRFMAQLSAAYRLPTHASAALGREATLVHRLWHAWHQQLREEGYVDAETAYAAQLENGVAAWAPSQHCYFAGGVGLSPFERGWIRRLLERGQATLVFQGGPLPPLRDTPHPMDTLRPLLTELGCAPPSSPPEDGYTAYLETVFSSDIQASHYAARAHRFASLYETSPAIERLFIYQANDLEAEARAVDVQIRRWLREGRRPIGIVSEDRRFARRLRALLERADVPLTDPAGWALSTTAAAAALERWLETLEENFAYQPLTDVLKSPFLFPDRPREEVLATVYRFEQDILRHENVGRDLDRYRQHLAYRRARLPQAVGTAVQELLDELERAARPLLPLIRARRPLSLVRYLRALMSSLKALGIIQAWETDPAGTRVLQEMIAMEKALLNRRLLLDWRGFRTWLGRTLERYNFQPPTSASPVQLLTLEHSTFGHYEALVIAGATREYLPGTGAVSPFFNDGVRRELGLLTARDRYVKRLYHFRRLLQAAPQVLITTRRQENGEAMLPSPWLETLWEFHRIAYGAPLGDQDLGLFADHPEMQVVKEDPSPLPVVQRRPAPPFPAALLPDKISSSAYQDLMNCPYQFYAARGLRLTAPEEIRDALKKSDYGERVHLILRAFHSGAPGYAGPYPSPFLPDCRDDAIRFLEQVSRAVFARDLEDNFLHRGWLQRWLRVVPQYVDWQIERAARWQTVRSEVNVEVQRGRYVWQGRLDRIDRSADGLGIIDYKTGAFPNEAEVAGGEAIQLPFYALLFQEPVHQAGYLSLDPQRVRSGSALVGEDLRRLTSDIGGRLEGLLQALEQGAPVPAWGDEGTCRYCQMAGVCRREVWIHGHL